MAGCVSKENIYKIIAEALLYKIISVYLKLRINECIGKAFIVSGKLYLIVQSLFSIQ